MILRKLRGLGAVDGEHEGLLKKGILDGLQVGVERDDAVAAGLVGEGDQLANQLRVVLARRGEDVRQAAKCSRNRGQRELEQHRAQCAAKDNKRRSGLQNLAEVAAFDEQTGDNAGHGQKHSADARFIHVLFLLQLLNDVRKSCCSYRSGSSAFFGCGGGLPG